MTQSTGDTSSSVEAFLRGLTRGGFTGEARDTRAARVVNATDNSIYYREPMCVLEPISTKDIVTAVIAAGDVGLTVTPRGGGTGTNGQSLSSGVVVDTSRFMNKILSYDASTGIVRVEPGVVLDQLNAFLKERHVFFPPAVSTASRATLGGMVATDASGKGSRRYGRTSDYLHAADVVFSDGSIATLTDVPPETPLPEGRYGDAIRILRAEMPKMSDEIARVFPVMNRGLSGYNLDELRGADGTLRMTKLLAGSEGTLAIVTALELKVRPLPNCKGAAIIGYPDSIAALGAVAGLLPADPDAIEFLDDRTVMLGKTTPVWTILEPVLGHNLTACGGYLFVEVTGESAAQITARLTGLQSAVAAAADPVIGMITVTEPAVLAGFDSLRKDAVGLMGKGSGPLKGVAFVEDAAVPPENLVAFVQGFRAILDSHGLNYGMYGHADVGCVHVRPLMDMRRPEHRAKIRPISDAVADLAQAQGGLIWGEHGKGVRGEYVAQYFGPKLFAFLRQIKAAFDPDNRLNPGKLVTAADTDLRVEKLDQVPFRGTQDQKISNATYAKAVACNGNGACFHWDVANEMCPSYKATRDRVQSPKGRAALIRDWQYAIATGGAVEEAENALAASLETCVSCKACESQCPVQVDIPSLKAAFLQDHYRTRTRSLRDRVLRHMEMMSLLGARTPLIANLALTIFRRAMSSVFGLVDLPTFARQGLNRRLRSVGARELRPADALPEGTDPSTSVILLCDSFLGPFEPQVLESTTRVLVRMGFTVFHTPIQMNGKAQHVRGYLKAFESTRDKAIKQIHSYSSLGLPMITVEPAVAMLYRHEYEITPEVASLISLDAFLMAHRERIPVAAQTAPFRLIGHCTETSADPANLSRWQSIFAAANLSVTPERAGCCGMAGLFGHEAEHRTLSRQIFDLAWAEKVEQGSDALLATGFSCRGQAKRFANASLRHPIQALDAQLDPHDR